MYKSQVPASEPSVNDHVMEEPARDLALQLRELAHHPWPQRGASFSDQPDRLKAEEEIVATEEYRKSWENWYKSRGEYPVEAVNQR